MRHHARGKTQAPRGPSQRQLRAGELVRHALAEVLRGAEVADPALQGVSLTISEVRMSPDLRHATCFVEPLGAKVEGDGLRPAPVDEVIKALNRAARFLRGRLGHAIALKFTPDLRFVHDASFDAASAMDALFARPEVARDLRRSAGVALGDSTPGEGAPGEGAPDGGAGDAPGGGGLG